MMLVRTPSSEWERPSGEAPGGLALVLIVPATFAVALLFACLLGPEAAFDPTIDNLTTTIGGP